MADSGVFLRPLTRAAFSFALLGLLSAAAQAATVTVNCSAGETVTDALAAPYPNEPLIIVINGTCQENVTIKRDDVTLRGRGPSRSEIRGVPESDIFLESPITLAGVQNITIEKLSVTGGESSGIVGQASVFTVAQSLIKGHGRSGIVVAPGSTARIKDSTIRRNDASGISCTGGWVFVTDSSIRSNGDNGITVNAGCNGIIGEAVNGKARPNTITDNSSGVVAIRGGAAFIANNTIEDNDLHGVYSHLGGSVVLTNNTIEGNGVNGVRIEEGSNGRLEAGNTIISDAPDFNVGGTVLVTRNSSLRIRGGGNSLINTAPRTITNDSAQAGGFALDVEMVSNVRQDGGHASITGNVNAFNTAALDLRDVDIIGSVYADGLNSNIRFQDRSQPSANITLTGGNLYTFGDKIAISGGSRQPVFDGNIDCNGSDIFIRSPNFTAGNGFVNCPGIP